MVLLSALYKFSSDCLIDQSNTVYDYDYVLCFMFYLCFVFKILVCSSEIVFFSLSETVFVSFSIFI